MDKRHYSWLYTNSNCYSTNIRHVLCSHKAIRELFELFKPLLNPKNIIIPFTTISSTFLFANFTHASTFKEIVFRKKGILTTDFSGEDKTTWFGIGEIVKNIIIAIEWLKDIKQHIYQWSLDLLSFTYETLINIVLHTPLFLFNNSFVKNTSITFSIVSISIVILLTIFEMIMKMLNKKHTDFKNIMKRFPLAIALTGFSPFLFEQAFKIINKLTKGISHVGGVTLSGDSFANLVTVGEIDVLILLLFDITLLGLLIPVFLQQGRRWWSLFCLSAISPLAMSTWIFDRHSHLFDQWWSSVKRLSIVQLVYSVFIVLMGIFIYATRFISPELFLVKLLIVIGGLYSLINPPQIVKSYSRGDGDVFDMYDNYKKSAIGLYNTVTLKNFRPAQFLKKKQQSKLSQISKLRKQHGRRYVGDLLK